MIPPEYILEEMQRQPPCWVDRHRPKEHAAHMVRVSEAISEVSRDTYEAAAMVSIGYSETKWCVYPRKNPGRGPWQVEKGANAPHFEDGDIRGAAFAGITMWRRSWNCGPGLYGRFTAYAGRPCGQAHKSGWPTLDERVSRFWRAYSNLEKKNERDKKRATSSSSYISKEEFNTTDQTVYFGYFSPGWRHPDTYGRLNAIGRSGFYI